MPQKVLKFTGINRVVNEFQGSGACEELINLRPDGVGGLSVVRPKHIEHNSVPYERVYVHAFGNINNKIAVTSNGSVDWINPKVGDVVNISSKFSSGNLSICFAGNVMLVYDEDTKENTAFKYEDDEYKLYNAYAPSVRAWIDYRSMDDTNLVSQHGVAEGPSDSPNEDTYNEALDKAASAFYEYNKNGLCGVAVVGCTFELEDGSEVWSTAFVVANNEQYKSKSPTYIRIGETYAAFVYGTKQTRFCLSFDEDVTWVKKINVYSTKPILPYRRSNEAADKNERVSFDDLNLAGQLMYYQGSIDPENAHEGLVLDFSSKLLGENVMDVTPGCIERVGPVVSYNNRFHFYHSEAKHIIQKPALSSVHGGDPDATSWIAYVKFEDKWKLIDDVFGINVNKTLDVIYPMSNIKEIVFVKKEEDTVSYDEIFRVDLKNSSAYNYSYAFGVTPTIESGSSFRDIVAAEGQLWSAGFSHDTKVLMRDEVNVINVTVPYNPFAFSINASYSVGGEIKDITTAYIPVSSTQIGQFPLTVFTTNGIFALEQGSGNVLYSNITPLQPHVITGKTTATPAGTFFISSNGIHVLSGREVLNISQSLNGERELTLRELDSYKRLCCSDRPLFNFSTLLSNKDFEEFVADAHITYDQMRNEIYISSKDENTSYSYVFNLNTNTCHKVAKKYISSVNGSRYVVEMVGDDKNIVDLHTEDKGEQPILLQSRPMPIEAFFTHIHRLILFADAKLNDNQYLTVSVFGSDNLNDWKCIISSQKMDTAFRQIRTNRAAKSYRDYVILITGVVDTNTDISELIADYTVVNRRLG